MKIIISTFVLLLFTISSFGQVKPGKLPCFDLKVKKFDFTYALSAHDPDTHIGVDFKVKNIGEINYSNSNSGTLKLYAVIGNAKIAVETWTLPSINAGNKVFFNWGNNYPPGQVVPKKFEAVITLDRAYFDCDRSNNSRIEEF